MDHIPDNPPAAAGPGPDKALRDAVNIPGYLLMATGALVVLFWLISLLTSVLGGGSPVQLTELPPEFYSDPNLAPYRAFLERLMAAQAQGPSVGEILYSLLGVGLGGLIAFGGLQMTKFRMYGVALAASIVAMVPCFSCCCCAIGVPVGIWALVVLSRPEVKAAFR
ncbi:MAG TPA: hypothetical protein VFZ09_49510 [Archangium sp.]|uniref:hypothetical protein n=1 Tax=Archangium sp. TaxID=1872627 RepID=UPI002E30703E|nr:hypothetical protein [Archangium sp.]HEX5754319.1 hypothetical protein [Archangium sp.]